MVDFCNYIYPKNDFCLPKGSSVKVSQSIYCLNCFVQVKRLVPDSIAGVDGRLQKDDLIIAVNGNRLKGITQGDALGMLKSIPKTIILTVRRDQQNCFDEYNNSKNSIRLNSETEDGSSRRSRSETKEIVTRRSRSESRSSIRSKSGERSRSTSRLSRFFRGSNENLNDSDTKETGIKKMKMKDIVSRKFSRGSMKTGLLTVYVDKNTVDDLNFTISGGRNTIYGGSPVIIETVTKGSDLAKRLQVGDEIVSVQGCHMADFTQNEAWNFLVGLPVGRICMSIQRR